MHIQISSFSQTNKIHLFNAESFGAHALTRAIPNILVVNPILQLHLHNGTHSYIELSLQTKIGSNFRSRTALKFEDFLIGISFRHLTKKGPTKYKPKLKSPMTLH